MRQGPLRALAAAGILVGSLAMVACGPTDPTATVETTAAADRTEAGAPALGQLPRGFETNAGQANTDARFLLRGRGFWTGLDEGGWELAFLRGAQSRGEDDAAWHWDGAAEGEVARVRLAWEAGVRARLIGAGTQWVTHYYLGDAPVGWRTNVATYAEVRAIEPYPGIDIVFRCEGGLVRFVMEARPGSDPTTVRWRVEGADEVRREESGAVAIELGRSRVTWSAPEAWQPEEGGGRSRVSARFAVEGATIGLKVGPYDRERVLIVE